MKASSGFRCWRPWVGVMALGGIFVCSVAFRASGGLGTKPDRGPATNAAGNQTVVPMPVDRPLIPGEMMEYAPNYAVRDERVNLGAGDRGALIRSDGTRRILIEGGAVAGGPCADAFECDDCNPCTEDACAYGTCVGGATPGKPCDFDGDCGLGTCGFFGPDVDNDGYPDNPLARECAVIPVSAGNIGESDDLVNCVETGPNAGQQALESCDGAGNLVQTITPCPGGQKCNPFFAGDRPGSLGVCMPTCTPGSCGEPDPATLCNGLLTCDATGAITGIDDICYTQGWCEGNGPGPGIKTHGTACLRSSECSSNLCAANPCGQGAPCFDRLNPQTPSANYTACQTAFPANVEQGGNVCCGFGRCCDGGNCSRTGLAECLTAPRQWLATGDSNTTPAVDDAANCNVTDITHPTTPGLDVGCPEYSAGIKPRGVFTTDNDAVTAAPQPPIFGAPAPCRANAEIGDDYTLNIPNGQYLALRTIRYFIGGTRFSDDGGRLHITFYDGAANKIEDIVTGVVGAGTGMRTTVINFIPGADPEMIIPKTGYVSLSLANNFDHDYEWNWLTSDSVDVGTNDPAVLFYNGGSTPANTLLPPGVNGYLAFELAGDVVDPPLGACCDSATGTCSLQVPWLCTAGGDVFQGVGTLCGVCDGDDLTPCDEAADCNIVGGPCVALPACGTRACCNNTTGACTQVLSPTPCPGGTTAQGFGSSCDPDCCVRTATSGGDNCEDATVQVLALSADPNVVTTRAISGNNSAASFPDSSGGAISFFRASGDPADPGWWEAFTFTGATCAAVRLDFCCSAPVHEPAWAFINVDCPSSGGAQGNGTVPPPIGVTEDNSSRGQPFCTAGDDNLWQTFYPLPTNLTYYYPVYSDPEGAIGPYQLHITAAACPQRACCLQDPVCLTSTGALQTNPNGSPKFCPGGIGQCTAGPGVVCRADCAALNTLDCTAVGGFWLGEGNIPVGETPVVDCTGSPCALGSCCLGPGDCQDRSNDAIPCDRNTPATCMDEALCLGPTNGEKYVGGALCDYPIEPCPFCEFEGAANCQPGQGSPGGGFTGLGAFSDRSLSKKSPLGSEVVAADDFIPAETPLTRVCVQGVYLDNTLNVTNPDCGTTTTDTFKVRVYANGADNLPGALLAERAAVIEAKTIEFDNGYIAAIDTYRVQLRLTDPNNPNTDMPIAVGVGTCHWIEVSADPFPVSSPTADNCDWFWFTRTSTGEARDGNDLYAYRAGAGAWLSGSNDLAFCMDIDFAAGGCGDRNGACCSPGCEVLAAGSVAAPSCAISTPLACDAADSNSSWDGGETCGTFACTDGAPPGDVCATIPPNNCPGNNTGTCVGGPNDGDPCDNAGQCAPDGGCNCDPNGPILLTTPNSVPASLNFTNNCATSDGPNPTETESGAGNDNTLNDDLWVQYVTTCTGRLVIDNCGTPSGYGTAGGFDSEIAVYHDPANPTVCACPTTNDHLWPNGIASDEGCNLNFGGPGILRGTEPVSPGQCYMIRVGGWQGDNGSGALRVNCEPVLCTIASAPTLVQIDSNAGAPTSLVDMRNNRHLAIQAAGSAGQSQAIRVHLKTLPPPWNVWNGRKMWVTTPQAVCETSGVGPGGACGAAPTYQRAGLSCSVDDAAFLDWTTIPGGRVYVTHPGLVPNGGVNAEYEVQMLDSTCDATDEGNFSLVKLVLGVKWGDVCGGFDPSIPGYVAANGSVDVAVDVTAALNKFGNRPNAPNKARVDVEPCVLDGKINITDVTRILDGFRNLPYPFSPTGGFGCTSADPCTYTAASEVAAGD